MQELTLLKAPQSVTKCIFNMHNTRIFHFLFLLTTHNGSEIIPSNIIPLKVQKNLESDVSRF